MSLSSVNREANMHDDDISNELKRDFQSHVNIYMCFKDKSVKSLYEIFAKTQVSIFAMFSVFTSYSIFGFMSFIFSIMQSHEGTPGAFFILALCLANFIAPSGMLIVYAKMNEQNHKAKYFKKILPWVPYLETYLTIASSMFIGFVLFCRTYAGACPSFQFIDLWGCNPQAPSHALPQDTLILMALLPIVFSTVFRNVKWEAVFLSWIIIIIWIAICIGIFEMHGSIYTLIFYTPLSFAMLYENQRQYLSSFFLRERLRNKVRETEQLATDYGTEVRHMMGNMTHDLKTPMSGFSSGLEGIEATVLGCSKRFQDGTNDMIQITASIGAVLEAVTQLKIINNFMLVTVNRCIDYTKVSKGLKLIPRNETICVTEALDLPLHCMRGIQSRIEIVLLPLPSSICSHIITDKQWLQENILCLLSNAVKYSSGGRVTVKLSLISSESELPSRGHNQLRRCTIKGYDHADRANNNVKNHLDSSGRDAFIIDMKSSMPLGSNGNTTEVNKTSSQFHIASVDNNTSTTRSINSHHDQQQNDNVTDNSFLRSYHQFDVLPVSLKYPQKQQQQAPCQVEKGINEVSATNVSQNITHGSTRKTHTTISDESGGSCSVNRNNTLPTNELNTIRSNKSSFSNWFSTKGFSPQPVVVDTSWNGSADNNHNDDYFVSLSAKSNKSQPQPPPPPDLPSKTMVDYSSSPGYNLHQLLEPHRSQSSKSTKGILQTSVDTQNERSLSQLLLIEVEDSGIGISEAVVATLFSPFKQAQRLAGGTGLGLFSLAKRVEALNGYYGVRNRVDGDSTQGSNFWFAIPYKPDTEAANMERLSFVSSGLGFGGLSPQSRSFLSLAMTNDDKPPSLFSSSSSSSSSSFPSSATSAAFLAMSLTPLSSSRPLNLLTSPSSNANLVSLDTTRSTTSINSGVGVSSAALNILLVDDSPSILKMTGMMLRRNNHTVTEAIHGADALEKLASVRKFSLSQKLQQQEGTETTATADNLLSELPPPFDVIIMDLQMPVMDGLECTTRLRKIESQLLLQSSSTSYIRQKVIVCSANSDEDTTRAAYAAGVDAFLAKPLTMKAFNLTYQKVINATSNSGNNSPHPPPQLVLEKMNE